MFSRKNIYQIDELKPTENPDPQSGNSIRPASNCNPADLPNGNSPSAYPDSQSINTRPNRDSCYHVNLGFESSVDNVNNLDVPDDNRKKEYVRRISSHKSRTSIHSNSLGKEVSHLRRSSIFPRQINDEDNPFRRKLSFVVPTEFADEELFTEEAFCKSASHIFIFSLFAGFGNVGAGWVLGKIQLWQSFQDISELNILVPSLLGLKGNLEMTMAARLSTEANLGHMDSWSRTLKMISGDMSLVQCQATVISFLASIVAILISFFQDWNFSWKNSLDLTASAMVAANIACFFLGLIMALIIVFSNKFSVNPDNIATPIAASLGDVSTAGIFALMSELIHNDTLRHNSKNEAPFASIITIAVFFLLLPIFYSIARRNKFTHELVHSGWTPIILAMIISSGGGLFLDRAIDRYNKLPPFQPVICGVGGNLVAISASRLSTWLFRNSNLGLLPDGITRLTSPLQVFSIRKNINTKLSLFLLLMSIPCHLLYVFVICLIQRDNIIITGPLICSYILFSFLQVLILLVLGYNLVNILWSKHINPDNSSIPLLTSFGDLLGSGFLLLAFLSMEFFFNDPNARFTPNLMASSFPLPNQIFRPTFKSVQFNNNSSS